MIKVITNEGYKGSFYWVITWKVPFDGDTFDRGRCKFGGVNFSRGEHEQFFGCDCWVGLFPLTPCPGFLIKVWRKGVTRSTPGGG